MAKADDRRRSRDDIPDRRSRSRRERTDPVDELLSADETRRLRCILFVARLVERALTKAVESAASWLGTLIWSAGLTFLLWVLGKLGAP